MNTASKEWRKEILQEYLRLRHNDETLHNRELDRHILATWERDSPKLWADLQRLQITKQLAYVLQQRMWTRQKELLQAGMPVTDAREMAEREILMLEPEQDVEDRALPPLS